MKKFRYVKSASSDESSRLSELIDMLEDDFDYIISGLEKLDRSGKEASQEGASIAEQLQSNLQNVISEIGSRLSQ